MKKKLVSHHSSKDVIITGATGFIGQHLVPILLKNNFKITAITRDIQKAKNLSWFKEVHFIECNIHQKKPKIKISNETGLIHLAWQGLPNYQAQFHIEENLPHNFNFIKELVLRKLNHVLITGTCLEYGFQHGPLSSQMKPKPNTPYAVAKDRLRKKIELLSKENSLCLQWARLFYMYGKGQNSKSIISELDSAIEKKEKFFNMSGGEQLRDYLPVEEVAQQLFDLYVSKKPGTFNVCSGHPISIRRLAENRIKEHSSKIKLNLGHFPYPEYEPLAFWGMKDVQKTIYLPTLPNAPLNNQSDFQGMGPIRLRKNDKLDFIENEAFDQTLIDYSQNYENSQAFSGKFYSHMKNVLSIIKTNLPKNSLMIEVGCGKGDFVEMVQEDGYFQIRGFDASYDGSNKAIEKRYLHFKDRIKADVVVLRHVLEHIPQPHKFLNMLVKVFGSSKIYIEVPNFDWILKNKTFFDITYEHVNYFSKTSLKKLFKNKKTEHGYLFEEQYQYILSDISSLDKEFEITYDSKNWCNLDFDALFPEKNKTLKRIDSLLKDNSLFLWGAATKGCLFLAHCKSNKTLLKKVLFAIDQNPSKQGKFLPGSLIPIKPKKDFFKIAKDGDVLLICNPAYKKEIQEEIKKSLKATIQIEVL